MEIQVGKKCAVINCCEIAIAKNMCAKHYKRWQRHGEVSEQYGKRTINGGSIQKHPLYTVWRNMTRLAKGQYMCERWEDFLLFVEDIKEKPEGKYYFTRIDATKKFSKDNVFWREITCDKQQKARSRREYMKKLRDNNPEYFVSADLKKKYGITLQDYRKMEEAQNGVCKICKQKEIATDYKYKKIRRLSVDHCHETNEIRGLLCSACNTAIGLLKHDEKLLKSAINYLLKTGDV